MDVKIKPITKWNDRIDGELLNETDNGVLIKTAGASDHTFVPVEAIEFADFVKDTLPPEVQPPTCALIKTINKRIISGQIARVASKGIWLINKKLDDEVSSERFVPYCAMVTCDIYETDPAAFYDLVGISEGGKW